MIAYFPDTMLRPRNPLPYGRGSEAGLLSRARKQAEQR
jgi:hypothetical protein